MNTVVTYPADKPVQVFKAGQAVILQVDALTMIDDLPIPKNTRATIHTSASTYKIDRRNSGATGNPKPAEVEYHFTVSRTVNKAQLGENASDVINDVLLRPKDKGDRVTEQLMADSEQSFFFLKTPVLYRVKHSTIGTYTHQETLNAGQEIKIMRGPMSQKGNRPTGRDYVYAPVRGWTKEVVILRGKPLVHSAFRAA